MAKVPSRRHLIPWLALLAMAVPGMAAGAPASITKSQIRSDPPGVTDRRLRDVVWSLFEKQDHRSKKDPTRPLSRLSLRTKVQATRVPNLCRYDSVRIEFERLDPKDEGPDAEVRPVGLTSSSRFAFVSPPLADPEDGRRERPSAARCSRLEKDQSFFTAEDEQQANDAYRAWLALLEAVGSGRKFPLKCELAPVDTGPCEAVIGALKPEDLWEVEACQAETGQVCHRLFAGDRLLTIVTTGHVHPGPPPGRIVSARLESLIVMAHEIID